MKNYNQLVVATWMIAGTLWMTSCQTEDIDTFEPNAVGGEYVIDNANPGTSALSTNGFADKSISDLTKDWWKFVLKYDCTQSPLMDYPVLSSTAGQFGNVVFLVGSNSGFATRKVDIHRSNTLLVPIINTLKSYPCDDALGKPAPGQSIEDFLKIIADKHIDLATNMKVTLDGRSIRITDAHRVATDLFYFVGSKDLDDCFNLCVTGQLQEAVSDGYWLSLGGLARGKHILRVHAEILHSGIVVDVTYYITVK